MNEFIKEKPSERIVNTAAGLFYKHGINAVGIAQICQEANVSKRTLYMHFDSKEALVVASVSQLGDAWFRACTSAGSSDPRERIIHVFKMFVPMAENEDFFGCILMNTSIELRRAMAPGAIAAREFKTKLYEYFKQQAILMKSKEPDVLAEQLIMLYDGCSAWIVMHRKFPVSTLKTVSMLMDQPPAGQI